jgi:hypothetical protein
VKQTGLSFLVLALLACAPKTPDPLQPATTQGAKTTQGAAPPSRGASVACTRYCADTSPPCGLVP